MVAGVACRGGTRKVERLMSTACSFVPGKALMTTPPINGIRAPGQLGAHDCFGDDAIVWVRAWARLCGFGEGKSMSCGQGGENARIVGRLSYDPRLLDAQSPAAVWQLEVGVP